MRGVIFLSGDVDTSLAQSEAREAELIVAADAGLLSARKCGFEPAILVGDFDSLPANELDSFRGETIRLDARKDETDGQAALDLAIGRGCTDIVLLGAMGGRLDHQLAHIALLMRAHNRGVKARILDGKSTAVCYGPTFIHIDGDIGDIISIIPLSDAYLMNTAGLRYPVRYEALKTDETRGVSNVLSRKHAVIELAGGRIVLIHTKSSQ